MATILADKGKTWCQQLGMTDEKIFEEDTAPTGCSNDINLIISQFIPAHIWTKIVHYNEIEVILLLVFCFSVKKNIE